MTTLTIQNSFTAIATSLESDLVTGWLQSKRAKTTRTTYQRHLKQFFKFVTGQPVTPESLGQFLTLKKSQAVAVVTSYLVHLRSELNRAPSTINVALSSIKSMVNYAVLIGKCNYSLSEIKGEKSDTLRDTSGVDIEGIKKLLQVSDINTLTGLRNQAILTLFWELGLRRCEVIRLNISDVDLANQRLSILGKGRQEKQYLDLSEKATNLLREWISRSGDRHPNDPLFIALDNSSYGNRISSVSVWKVVKQAGEKAELSKALSPHKIRHSAITATLDLNNGNHRETMAFSRHRNIQTIVRYDDNRKQGQKQLTTALSNLV